MTDKSWPTEHTPNAGALELRNVAAGEGVGLRYGRPTDEALAVRVNDRAFEYYAPLRKVKDFVEKNYPEKISLASVAKIAGLERKYLSAYFHRKVGITFRQWVTLVRVREALRRLELEDISITYVAIDVGLDIRSFERSVKKLTGCTPRELKRRVMP